MAQPRIATSLFVPPQPPLNLLSQQILAARMLRLDGVIVWDHFMDFAPAWLWTKETTWLAGYRQSPHAYYDYQTLLGHLAGRAGGLRLGVGVTEVNRRHPVLVAQSLLTLAHLTKRAPILGLGAGEHMNLLPYGVDATQAVGRLEEALQIIRRCFTSTGPIDFAGQHFQLNGALMDLQPPPGRTPEIWLAAHGPRMLRLAGQYADGWFPAFKTTPDDYASRLAIIHAAARAAGRDPAAITPALHASAVIAPSEEAVRSLIDTPAVRYSVLVVSTAEIWQRHGLAHPFGPDYRGFASIMPEQYDRQVVRDAMAAVTPDLTRDTVFCGTPDQLVADFRALGEAGLRHLTLVLVSAYPTRRAMFDTVLGLRTVVSRLRG